MSTAFNIDSISMPPAANFFVLNRQVVSRPQIGPYECTCKGLKAIEKCIFKLNAISFASDRSWEDNLSQWAECRSKLDIGYLPEPLDGHDLLQISLDVPSAPTAIIASIPSPSSCRSRVQAVVIRKTSSSCS